MVRKSEFCARWATGGGGVVCARVPAVREKEEGQRERERVREIVRERKKKE